MLKKMFEWRPSLFTCESFPFGKRLQGLAEAALEETSKLSYSVTFVNANRLVSSAQAELMITPVSKELVPNLNRASKFTGK